MTHEFRNTGMFVLTLTIVAVAQGDSSPLCFSEFAFSAYIPFWKASEIFY